MRPYSASGVGRLGIIRARIKQLARLSSNFESQIRTKNRRRYGSNPRVLEQFISSGANMVCGIKRRCRLCLNVSLKPNTRFTDLIGTDPIV